MDKDEICAIVLQALAKQVGAPLFSRFDVDTTINQTVDGDDAIELLEELEKAFGPVFEDFAYDDYFGPEQSLPTLTDLRNWMSKEPSGPPLTVGELVEFIENKINNQK